MTQQVAYIISGDFHQEVPRILNNAMFVQRLGDDKDQPSFTLTNADGTLYLDGDGVWVNPTWVPNPGWQYPNTAPNTVPLVPWSPNTLPGITFPHVPTFTITGETPRIKDIDTELNITRFLRYRFTADLHVSVGEEPKCKCGSTKYAYSSGGLTPQPVEVIIDGHRDDVFVSEEKEMLLPVVLCEDCGQSYYHLSLIREYL